MTTENDAEDRSQEKRLWELAHFCLSRARKALRHMHKLSIKNGVVSWDLFTEGSSEMEDMIIALQHVYASCKILNGDWPEPIPRAPRRAANDFVTVWRAADGEDLRDAYSHYEHALASSEHPLRDDAADGVVWHKMEYPPLGASTVSGYIGRPQTVVLLGKAYSLEGVYEAVSEVERELREVLAPIASQVEPPEASSSALPLSTLGGSSTGNIHILQQHNDLGGGIDWERKREIDAARNDEDC